MAPSSSLSLDSSSSTYCSPVIPIEQPTPYSELTERSEAAYVRALSPERQSQLNPFGADFLPVSDASQRSYYQLLRSDGVKEVNLYDLRGFDSFNEDHKMACVREFAQDTYSKLDPHSKQKIHMSIWIQLGSPREVDPMNWNQGEALADLAMFSVAFNSLSEKERAGLVFKYEVNSSPSFASSSVPMDQDASSEMLPPIAGIATVDHVATLPTSIDHEFIAAMEPPRTVSPDLFFNLRNDLKTYGNGEGKFKKNAEQLIELFESLSKVISKYDNNEIEKGDVCKVIKRIASNLNMGLHLDEFDNHKALIGMIRGTLASVQIAYMDAKANNMLPVFFIAGLGNGSCYNTRTEIITLYSDATHCGYRQEEKNQKLLELTVKTYATRMNQDKLPVDLDKFHRYLTKEMGLKLENFGIFNENPRENPLVRAMTISGIFSPEDDGKFFEAMMDEYTFWPVSGEKNLRTERGDEGHARESRAAFRQFLIKSQDPLLTEVNKQNVDRHIDNFIRLNRALLVPDLGEPIDEGFATLVSQLFEEWGRTGEKSELPQRDKRYVKENRTYFGNFLLRNESIQRIGIDKDNIDAYIDDFIRDKQLETLLGKPADEQRISGDRRRRNNAKDNIAGGRSQAKKPGGAQTSSSSSSGPRKGGRGGRRR